jgi:ABC-type xylose transport system permease subunit
MNDSVSPLATDTQASKERRSRARRLVQLLFQGDRPYMLYFAFAILLVVFSIASPWFLSIDNFLNIGRQTALVSIIAIGMTFVIIARQIDLSVGSTLALSGMSAALAMAHIGDNWVVGAWVQVRSSVRSTASSSRGSTFRRSWLRSAR